MELNADMDAEDIQLFLDETEELLQILGESFVELEHSGDDSEVLQEIFRAAHTLKGSAGMLGYREMTELAHAMETLLDEVRQGKVRVTTETVDALLHSLDGLTLLRDALREQSDVDLDVAGLVAELDEARGNGAIDAAEGEATLADAATLDVEGDLVAKAVAEAGEDATDFRIVVTFKPDSTWLSVRAFQLLKAAGEIGSVLTSVPTAEEVDAGATPARVELVLVSTKSKDEITETLSKIEDTTNVDVNQWVYEVADDSPDEGTAQATEAAATDESDATAPGGPMSTRKQPASTSAGSVRIDVERLDDLINALGELMVDHTRVHQLANSLARRYRGDDLVDSLVEATAKMDKNVDGLQEGTMRVRMQPIGTMFNGLPRMVRDLAQKMSKNIELAVSGHDTEIDRTVIDKVRDPLLHLLRNSVDHGIETPEDREKAGKPKTATVSLTAFHSQGSLVIRVEDDGRGIDAERIKESAIAKGVISPEVAGRLNEQEALQLIFAPGFSTAEKTTEVSGRGVGMDIVKSNIEQIRGVVEVSTKVGEGTRFDLRLPLTLATIPSQMVTLADDVYAVPLGYVLETVWMDDSSMETVMGGEAMRLRGTIVPVIRLDHALGGVSGFNQKATYVVVVQLGERMVGLGVDGLMEVGDVVVKPLEGIVSGVVGLSGATVLGDGRVGLILDVPTLVTATVNARHAAAA